MVSGCTLARRTDTWPILDAAYRGACRGAWWPLSGAADPEAKALTAAHDTRLLSTPPNEARVDASLDLGYLRAYVAVCDRLGIDGLLSFICVDLVAGPEPPAWLASVQRHCSRRGVDVIYGSGSFSFINGAFGARDEGLRALLSRSLNENRLFESFEAAHDFMAEYQAALDRGANLESLEDAMPVELWEDPELLALREALRG